VFSRRFDAQPAEGAPREKAEPIGAGLTGGLGRLPGHLLTDTSLSVEARFLIAFRCIHVRGGGRRGYGLNDRRVHKTLCAGFGRKVFQRAIRELREAGILAREQRGQSYATDRLTFPRPRAGFVLVEPALFDGSLTARDVVAILYLRLRGRQFVEPWQLRKVLGVSRSTLNACLQTLADEGLVVNKGTASRPLWQLANLQNPTLQKSPTFQKRTLQNRTHTRSMLSPRKEKGLPMK
jgi:biotin operon repressor